MNKLPTAHGMNLRTRGVKWVIVQIILFALLFGTSQYFVITFPNWVNYIGIILLLLGGMLGTAGVIALGKNLTPFPAPRQTAVLVTEGVYKYVRHPIYSGLVFGTLGWSLIIGNGAGLVLGVVLFIFFDAKSRREEELLAERFPEYHEYKSRVRKLVPFIY